jgi:hypothetical protein
MNRFIPLLLVCIAFAVAVAEDKPNAISGQPKIDAPKPSVRTGASKAAEEAAKTPVQSVPGTTPDLVPTLGPGIPVFETISGCQYADTDRQVLRFQVANAPDGERVRRVTINAIYDNDVVAGSVLVTPASSTAALLTRGTVRDSRLAWEKIQTVAYLLTATDWKGRTTTRRVNYQYFGHEPRLEYFGERHPPRRTVTPSGTTFRYALKFSVDDIAIRAIEWPDNMNLVRGGRSEIVPLQDVHLAISRPDGSSTTVRTPSQRFERATTVDLVFKAPVERYTFYRGRQYDSWSLLVRLALQHPPGCSNDPSILQVRVPSPTATRPAPEPEPEPETSLSGRVYEVTCECREPYGKDPKRETRVFQAGIRVCMANANIAGANLSCGLATTRLIPTRASSTRDPCNAISLPALSEDIPESCSTASGNLDVIWSNR